ncbi:aldehyde dehydrogenase family protein [Arthrobacter sp. TB 23]|uniref:aldehyde dehydrogenase family protein n=1 Tax=Arthrobacter sp. TB 23 TaxID=494419 RepID=UPI0002DB8C3A|nr:aldehyde dehydrogenase family protein [Arthrobacter sp. TB 23]
MKITGNLIDGTILDTSTGETIDVTNPADSQQVVGRVPAMTAQDIQSVYGAAVTGARIWRETGVLARGEILQAAAACVRDESDMLARLIVQEMGKTLAEARVEVKKTADFFDYYAGQARLPYGELLADGRPGTYARVVHEPLGVVLLITPWNDPLLTPARKMGPALLAGNAVIIKPATATPLIVLELARIFNTVGLPAGVLGTVTGRGRDIGGSLLEAKALKAVSFTGSTSVGLELQKQLAGRPVRVQTEMGGKNAIAVLADADIAVAAKEIVSGAFAQAGQRCTATSRVVVVRGVADQLIAAIREHMLALKVGAGDAEGITVGPVVSAAARKEIFDHIDRALGESAELLEGGAHPPEGVSEHGAFVSPTLLRVTRDQAIWRDEVFGPVLGILAVDNEQQAIEAVNDSDYGLAAAVFTSDLGAAERFITQAEAGQVSVNHPTTGWDVHHPFGGFGYSGSPFKEQGLDALQFYTRTKTVAVRAL